MKELLDAGVHFGHQTHKWNPRMKSYIFGERAGIHIINLEQTVPMFQQALDFVTEVVTSGGDLLFVGTKRQARLVVEEQAKRCGMHYVNNRWLGGTLTNFATVKASIDRLKDLEVKMADGSFDAFKKKERRQIEREITKLRKALGGIKEMESLPAALFIIDPKKEAIAQREANRLNIPVIAVVDTNCDPEGVDYLIPGNDDAIKAIRIFIQRAADACEAGLGKRQERIRAEVAAEAVAAEKGEKEETREQVIEVITEKAKAYVSRERAPAKKTAKKGVTKAKQEKEKTEKTEKTKESSDG